jgi:outer membrane protein assembly factor BamE (lipoprotein component of BamABCDE complex)
MKTFAVAVVVAACLAGLSGCVTPTHSYDQIHSRDWTHEGFDQRFPAGTSKRQVFEKLGGPFAESVAGDLTRWVYVGGASGQLHVALIYRSGLLVEKRFLNF